MCVLVCLQQPTRTLPTLSLHDRQRRLTHLQPSDVALLGRLRSLFCLSLAAPCLNAALLPGFPSAVRLQQVEDVVAARLPVSRVARRKGWERAVFAAARVSHNHRPLTPSVDPPRAVL
jgi:hypothetical protein